MNATLTTASEELSSTELKAAKRCSQMYDAAETMVTDLCQEIAQQCPQRGEDSQNAWLKVALPKCDDQRNRCRYLLAGKVLLEACRRRHTFELPWTVAAELHPLMAEHAGWCFAKKRTRQEIREYKRGLKLNAAAEAATVTVLDNKDVSANVQSPFISPEVISDDQLRTRVQFCDTTRCDSRGVSDVQSELGSNSGWEFNSMGTKSERDAERDWNELQFHLKAIRELHRRNFKPASTGLNEGQWRELSQEYTALREFADIRWERLRSELEQGRAELDRLASDANRTYHEPSNVDDEQQL